jgi:GNAT superfamily N-acetyltransferase
MDITIRPLDPHDLPEAERIFRLAFGTFLGLPDPMSFMGDADLVHSRWRAAPAATLGAYLDNTLVGSNFAANWGSFGFFGPLTVRPDLWDQGIAQRLLTATMGLFAQWGTRQAALFTSPQSPKHIALYQKFGFWPQYLTPVMAKPVGRTTSERWSTYSEVPLHARETCLATCRALTHAVYPGLDVQREIQAVAVQQLGDTVLIHDGTDLVAFAICHLGKGSEAGSGAAYIKFGAARPGPGAAKSFDHLLAACEALASARGIAQMVAGVNAARHDAYRMLLERGFRTFLEGVAMQRPNEPGYNRPDCFVIDDLR